MSMVPAPGKILELITLLDADFQPRPSFDSLLEQVVPQLTGLWPEIALARAYRPEANGLRLVIATDEKVGKTLESADLFAQALTERRIIHNARHALWGLPLADADTIYGLMIIQMKEDSPEAEGWLKLIAGLLTRTLARLATTPSVSEIDDSLKETRQLYELNQQMLAAQDPIELLRALRVISSSASSISHATFEYTGSDHLTDVVVRHVLKEEMEQVVEQSFVRSAGPEAMETIRQLAPGWDKPLVVEDCQQPPLDVPAEFIEADAGSMVLIPVHRQGQLTDLVRISYDQPRHFSEQSHRLFNAVRDQMSIVFQVQQSLYEAQSGSMALSKQVSALQTLNDLSTVISMARDEAQLFGQFSQALVTTLSVDYCQIHMLDNAQQIGTIVSEYPSRGKIGSQTPPEEVAITALIDPRSPAPIVINNVHTDWRLDDMARDVLENRQIEAFMLMPLFIRGQIIGVIRLDIQRPGRDFTNEMTEIAQTILAQVVVGLQNIRLLSESRLRSEQLQRVNLFGQTLQSTLDREFILETALTESHRIIPVERMMIALHDPTADLLRTAALYANGENYLTPENGAVVELEGSPVGRVWQNQRLLHIPDILSEELIPANDVRELRALLLMPLMARNHLLGVISVGHSQPNVYSETDIIVFQQMVGLLALAIENARAFAESQRQARNEALVNDISTRLQQQVDLDGMLQIAVNDLGRALGARRGRIRLGTRETE